MNVLFPLPLLQVCGSLDHLWVFVTFEGPVSTIREGGGSLA